MQQSQFVHGNSCNSQRFVHGNSCNTAVLQNSETHEIVAEIYKSWYCLKILQLVHATVEVFYNSCFSCRILQLQLRRQSQNCTTHATVAEFCNLCNYSSMLIFKNSTNIKNSPTDGAFFFVSETTKKAQLATRSRTVWPQMRYGKNRWTFYLAKHSWAREL